MEALTEYINPALWVMANMTLLYVCAALVLWVFLYGLYFRWYDTPAGSLIFWFTLSLLGVVGLVFVAIFVGGHEPWYIAPDDVLLWRPALRYAVYLGVAITLSRLVGSLVNRLRRRTDLLFDVVPRRAKPGE